jgi:hypothetical protein
MGTAPGRHHGHHRTAPGVRTPVGGDWEAIQSWEGKGIEVQHPIDHGGDQNGLAIAPAHTWKAGSLPGYNRFQKLFNNQLSFTAHNNVDVRAPAEEILRGHTCMGSPDHYCDLEAMKQSGVVFDNLKGVAGGGEPHHQWSQLRQLFHRPLFIPAHPFRVNDGNGVRGKHRCQLTEAKGRIN